jgi:hypothetical protein
MPLAENREGRRIGGSNGLIRIDHIRLSRFAISMVAAIAMSVFARKARP